MQEQEGMDRTSRALDDGETDSRQLNNVSEERPQETVMQIIENMSTVRADILMSGNIVADQTSRYQQLAKKLADGMRILGRDDGIRSRIDDAINIVQIDSATYTYDALQHDRWKQEHAPFVNALDALLISVAQEQFTTLDHTHHILQALKPQIVADKGFDEKEKTLATVLPYGQPMKAYVPLKKKLWGALVGSRHRIDEVDPMTARVLSRADPDDVKELLSVLSAQGYAAAELSMNIDQFRRLRNTYDGAVQKESEGSQYRAYVPLYKRPAQGQDIIDTLRTIATMELPSDLERQLVYLNNETAAMKLSRIINATITEPARFTVEDSGRDYTITYLNTQRIGEYRKDMATLLFDDRRYVLASIAPDSTHDVLLRARDLLGKHQVHTGEDKDIRTIERLADALNSVHLRVEQYQDGSLTDSYEVTPTKKSEADQ